MQILFTTNGGHVPQICLTDYIFLDSSYDVLSLHTIKWQVDSNENMDMEFIMVYFDRISFLTERYSYSFLLLTPTLLRRGLSTAILVFSEFIISQPLVVHL